MSTVCKLDPDVRRQRADRRAQRIEMSKDFMVIGKIIQAGIKITQSEDYPRYTSAARFKHERLLQEMTVRKTVMGLTYNHVTKICLDPARTGARKQAILNQLGAVPEAVPVEPSRLILPPSVQASTPIVGI